MTGDVRYPAGAKVLRDNFYERSNCSSVPQNVLFKLVSGKIAYVYAATVCFMFGFTRMFCRWFKAL